MTDILGRHVESLPVELIRNSVQTFGLHFISPTGDYSQSTFVYEIDDGITGLSYTAAMTTGASGGATAIWTFNDDESNWEFDAAEGKIVEFVAGERNVLFDAPTTVWP